jgi:hypothetical protein
MGYLTMVLQTKEAEAAIGHGFATWFSTGNLSAGIDAMFAAADRNGSLAAARAALLLDVLRAVFK